MTRRIVLIDIGNSLDLSGVLPSVHLHDSYSARVTARNGVAPYTYATDSVLPDGVELDPATGVISSGDVGTAGTFVIAVTATDLAGTSVTRDFVLSVVAEPLLLTISGSYAAATVGTPYSSDLTIANGGGTYSNPRVTVGALPAGLALSIVGDMLRLSGTPTGSAATVDFTVAVDSGDGQTATSAQSVVISGYVTDDFSTNTIASYTEYASVSVRWFVDTSNGGTMLQQYSNESVLTRNGVSFADGHVSMVTSQASDSGLALRLLDKNNYYLAVIKDGSHTPGNVVIVYKRVGGTFTQLGSSAINFPINTVHSLAFSANGSSLVASFDGTPVVTVTDTSIAGAGKCGMRSGSTSTGLNPFGSFTWPA